MIPKSGEDPKMPIHIINTPSKHLVKSLRDNIIKSNQNNILNVKNPHQTTPTLVFC